MANHLFTIHWAPVKVQQRHTHKRSSPLVGHKSLLNTKRTENPNTIRTLRLPRRLVTELNCTRTHCRLKKNKPKKYKRSAHRKRRTVRQTDRGTKRRSRKDVRTENQCSIVNFFKHVHYSSIAHAAHSLSNIPQSSSSSSFSPPPSSTDDH